MKIKSYTQVFSGDYPFSTDMERSLISILEKYPDKQNRSTNVVATMTEWQITHPQIEKFKKYIFNEIARCYPKMVEACTSRQLKPEAADFWANIYNKGDYTHSHNHYPSNFSIVYFLKSKWYYTPLVFDDSGKKIRPKQGRYVIFPGHINHHVPRHRFKEKRITLSSNVVFPNPNFQLKPPVSI